MVRPKDLRLPYPWKERHILIRNRVWFVPRRPIHDTFTFPGWEHPELFGVERPLRVEYCSGNGDWIVEKAKEDPESNWLAVEMRLDRIKKIWSKSENNGCKNIVIVWAEAFELTKKYLPPESIDEVFVNFPDPWPKRKHAIHRLIRKEFLVELARAMKPSSLLTCVTDDEPYTKWMIKELLATPPFESHLPDPYFHRRPQNYGGSFFDALFQAQEKEINQLIFTRK